MLSRKFRVQLLLHTVKKSSLDCAHPFYSLLEVNRYNQPNPALCKILKISFAFAIVKSNYTFFVSTIIASSNIYFNFKISLPSHSFVPSSTNKQKKTEFLVTNPSKSNPNESQQKSDLTTTPNDLHGKL